MPGLGIEVRGKVAATDQAETGRVIARLTDLGFGSRLRPLLAAEAEDVPVPDDLVKASVQVLASWDWAQRPAAVVRVGSVRRPRLIADLASRLAELGRLTDLGQVTHVRPSSTGRTNSALRLREVWNAYEMPSALAAQLTGQPVLLVDDFIDTGWTFTVVSRLAAPQPAPPRFTRSHLRSPHDLGRHRAHRSTCAMALAYGKPPARPGRRRRRQLLSGPIPSRETGVRCFGVKSCHESVHGLANRRRRVAHWDRADAAGGCQSCGPEQVTDAAPH